MKVTVTLPSGRTLSLPAGTTVERVLEEEEFRGSPSPIVAVLVNKALTSLSYPLEVSSRVEPVPLASRQGANVYRRSLCFLLAIAAKQSFPERRLIIGHSLGRGYLYFFDGMNRVAERELERLRLRMQELVDRTLPIRREVISYTEALRYFERSNQPDTVLLLKNRNDPKVPVYTCGEFMDLAHAPLLPHTGLLATFQIKDNPPGFLLRYPPWNHPEALDAFQENPVLLSIYREYKDWGKILGVTCVGHLNDLIAEGRVREFIQVAEALQDKKIAQIADRLTERRDLVRVVLIAGPSSSGKTTFSKKLAIQLRVLGRNPIMISQDDYFLPRELTPKDEKGDSDFEALEALDVALLNEQLIRLLDGKEVVVPRFDFHSGQRKAGGVPLKLPDRAVLILEGIHCLNDTLTPAIPAEQKYKIYVSALTQLNLDDHNRISTTDNRLLRRLVRDHQFRGHPARETLAMWQSVRNGEDRNIFPFQNKVDSAFNSALDYELAVLKLYADPLLRTIKPDQEQFDEALRLLSFLDNFAPIPPGWVPDYSLLREFIGESAFKY
jgi:uridine kinase